MTNKQIGKELLSIKKEIRVLEKKLEELKRKKAEPLDALAYCMLEHKISEAYKKEESLKYLLRLEGECE